MRTIISFEENWIFTKPGEDCAPVTLPHTWNAIDGRAIAYEKRLLGETAL